MQVISHVSPCGESHPEFALSEGLTRWWAYEEGQLVVKEGRRPAGYYLKARTRGPQWRYSGQ